jgi:hypothetical protein
LVTLTAVQSPGRFGAFNLGQGETRITAVKEKALGDGAWINGGFFAVEPEAFEHFEGDSTAWEREPMENLAKRTGRFSLSRMRLLASQVLNLSDFSITARPLITDPTPMPYDQVLHDAESALRLAFKRLSERYDRVFVTVTDGFDSRLMLAAAAGAGANPIGVTFSNEVMKCGVGAVDNLVNPKRDRILPPMLCQAVGAGHLFIPRARFKAEYDDKFTEHTANAAMDGPARSRFGHGKLDFGLPTVTLL